MLVRLLKTYPDLPRAAEIRAALDDSFLPAALAQEADYFRRYKLANTFERTYGWAWLLKLDQELVAWDDPHGRMWHAALKPLVDSIVQLWTGFLPKQTYPNRTGVHPNTAFGLAFAFDWARASGNTSFEKLIVSRARDYYLGNVALAAVQEPDRNGRRR